jgi:NitT/TauT family transport system substrate-binding protein
MNGEIKLNRRMLVGALAASTAVLSAPAARAEISEVRIAQQFGLPFLPLIVARNRRLIEARAAAAGIGNLKVNWVRLGGGAAVNDALISGSIDFGTAGLGPVLTLWDKTRSNLDIRAVLSLDASAVLLNVNRPDLKTLADLKDSDRIALPAVKVSQQAVLLQMAAEKAFGAGQYARFDKLTVTLPHPEAYVALLSGKGEITGHFGNSPFIYQELDNPKIHTLISSEEILGGLGTVTSVFAAAKTREANPKVYKAVLDGLRDALDLIDRDKALVARIFVEEEKSSLTASYIQALIERPSARYSAAPINSFKFAEFMLRTGALKNRPASWRDYFFPDIHALPGS